MKKESNMTYCSFCEIEAEYIIVDTKTPICPACKRVMEVGQASPDSTIETIETNISDE